MSWMGQNRADVTNTHKKRKKRIHDDMLSCCTTKNTLLETQSEVLREHSRIGKSLETLFKFRLALFFLVRRCALFFTLSGVI